MTRITTSRHLQLVHSARRHSRTAMQLQQASPVEPTLGQRLFFEAPIPAEHSNQKFTKSI